MPRELVPRSLRVPRFTPLAVLLGLIVASEGRSAEPLQFDRDIRPILSENCFHCHGPDDSGRQGDLRLDTREGAILNGGIVPGKSAESEILRRLRSTDPDEQMPPPKSNRHVSPQQVELLARWIDEGANWSKHWSFEPIRRPTVPAVAGYGHNPIDAFIKARLERAGWQPASEAEAFRLLRRVTMDLTGLPPSLEEQESFLNDSAPGRYERLVDRLLASPRYGERMVWDWLDAARYADTNGYQGDPTRAMWYWRDWALGALNQNTPFDQFTVEQLAGDLLPNPTREQLVATGFHRNHMINGEGGRIAEESRIDYVQDRVESTGTVWLGLTLNCCRCHNHKYDPISQQEYYQLAAYFNSIEESGGNDAGGLANPLISLATDEQQTRLAELRTQEQAAQQEIAAVEQRVLQEFAAWESAVQARLAASAGQENPTTDILWKPLIPSSLTARGGTSLKQDAEGVVTATGPNPAKDVFSMIYPPPGETITAFRLEALPEDGFVNSGPGRADNGNFVLSEMVVEVYGRAWDLDPLRADFEQEGWSIQGITDGKPTTGWAVMPRFGERHELIVAPKAPLVVPSSEVLTVRLAFDSPHLQHVLGKYRLSYTTERPEIVRGMPADVVAALNKPQSDRNEADQQLLRQYYLKTNADVIAARDRSDQVRSRREQLERSLPRTMVMRERVMPRETNILTRGAYDRPAEVVQHGVPAVLPALPANAAANRLELARWLVSPEQPLTARVVVNRVWQNLMGQGLVKTVDDFGSQGEKPSHPELLDWLAAEFRESGWDVKHIQRLIVTSATYRQSSRVSAADWERDPENRLLSRGPRQRWTSWQLRDQALAVSGLLQEQIGGPPVKGYQPSGIWEEATFGKIRYEQDHGPALHRRSLYQFWRRIVGPTVFFDVSSRQQCTVKVVPTNTPLQALVLLNDVTYVEAARALGQRVWREGGTSTADRLTYAYRLCLSRPPTEPELQRLTQRYGQLVEIFSADEAAARNLIATGETVADAGIPPAELATWTTLASLLLNLDETLSKE